MRRTAFLAVALLFLMPFTVVAPASAQAFRTWISGVGDDANPCSRTAPCKTFAGAISKTAAFGEINVLDPGGFGAVTITKSITLRSDHVEAGILAAGTNGIVVNVASTDVVTLDGLDIVGVQNALNGVQIVGSGNIKVQNCRISGFSGNGVNVVGAAGARVVVLDSIVTANSGGLNVAGAGGAANNGILVRTVVDNNPSFGVSVTSPSKLILSDSTLLGSAASIVNNGGATVLSFGNNAFNGTGAPTVTQALR
ncbi:hypothetical protein XH89_11220 [Bradyrhizobium sp. CCBAU 53340]|uniref:right-handed parallel beta-helix repeat-containing protein n=1 Tax=Bradyrhizobium sp. CCBAU 53340 TaxID=1325112 RepID=UPI00188AD23F|nr:right-handed parallel beta-helix repeat-containing protein [Bradyrhizobium sp. CCBAU 53340]QOZ43993.1 hypothetical protein XH89_11220 [Bradyrhizobium sp. CCBAU 53340]